MLSLCSPTSIPTRSGTSPRATNRPLSVYTPLVLSINRHSYATSNRFDGRPLHMLHHSNPCFLLYVEIAGSIRYRKAYLYPAAHWSRLAQLGRIFGCSCSPRNYFCVTKFYSGRKAPQAIAFVSSKMVKVRITVFHCHFLRLLSATILLARIRMRSASLSISTLQTKEGRIALTHRLPTSLERLLRRSSHVTRS